MSGPYDIFILGGQSNAMYAYAYNQADTVAPAHLYQIKQNQTIAAATQCMDFAGLGGGTQPLISFSVFFCRDYYIPQKLQGGRDVLIVTMAQGGSGFYGVFAKKGGQHDPSAEAGYTNGVALINAALAAGSNPSQNKIVGLFWQHGEEDAADSGSGLGDGSGLGYYQTMTRSAGYTRYFSEMIAGLKADVTGGKFDSTVPIMLGSPPPCLAYFPSSAQLPNYPSGIGNSADGADHHNSAYVGIIQAMAAMPGNVSNCAYVDPLNPFKLETEQCRNPAVVQYYLHFSQVSHRELARRYWLAYRGLVESKTVVALRPKATGQPSITSVLVDGVTADSNGFETSTKTPTLDVTCSALATGDVITVTDNEATTLLTHTVTSGENGSTSIQLVMPTLSVALHLFSVRIQRGQAKSNIGVCALSVTA